MLYTNVETYTKAKKICVMILPHMFLYFLHVSMLLGMHARPQNNLILCGSFSLEAATTCNFNLHLVSWPHCPLGLCPHTCYYKKITSGYRLHVGLEPTTSRVRVPTANHYTSETVLGSLARVKDTILVFLVKCWNTDLERYSVFLEC